MKDRLIFETQKLKNGMTVYGKPWDVPFASIKLFVPVGTRNNFGSIVPGSAHFLEHSVCRRSQNFPQMNGFRNFLSLKGGSFNAATSQNWTQYELSIPTEVFAEVFTQFIHQVFNPLIKDEYIAQEASVISNERRRKNIWYPSNTKLGQYVNLGWKSNYPVNLRQIFGDDSDLKEMTAERLYSLHNGYRDPRTHLFIGGTYDCELVYRELENIQTCPNDLKSIWKPLTWQNRTYHEVKCGESDRYIYYFGGIIHSDDLQVDAGMDFLGSLLVESTQAVLFDWLRHELGWVYNMGCYYDLRSLNEAADWGMWIPLNNREQVEHVRKELHNRIQKAILDQKNINAEAERILAQRVFRYQTVDSVLQSGINQLHISGKIFTEEEIKNQIHKSADSKVLQKIYDEYWVPEVSGEFLATPENS